MPLIEQAFEYASYRNVFGLAVALLLVRYVVRSVQEELSIRKLGSRASVRTSYLPGGLDFTYGIITRNAKHLDLFGWRKFFMTYGPPKNPWTIETAVGGQRIIFTADAENIKAILATSFEDYGKGEEFNETWHEFLGDSIFTTDGKQWSTSRAMIRTQFVKERISDIDLFERNVAVLLDKIPNGQEVDIKELFHRFTLDAITEFLLGASVDSLNHPQNQMTTAFAEVQHVQSIIARTGPLHPLVPRKTFRQGLKVMNEYLEPYIDATLALTPEELANRTKSDDGYTFLHALAVYTRDRALLRDQLMSMFLAGRDTTACTLSWVFYELSRRPDIVSKIRKEIGDTVGWSRPPTYADLKSMKYLQYTLNETLRMYPTVPFNVRMSLKDTTLPHGGGKDGDQPVGVPANTPVGYSTLALHMLTTEYPPPPFPDPRTFEPSRWFSWTPKAWTYIPFNGGPRLCVGQQFALTEMQYTITRIFQHFSRVETRMTDLKYAGVRDQCLGLNKGTEMGLQATIVLAPSDPVTVAFYKD